MNKLQKRKLFKNNKIFTRLQKIESEAIFPPHYRNALTPYLKNVYSTRDFNYRYNPDGTTYREYIYDFFNDKLMSIKNNRTRKIERNKSNGNTDFYEKAEIDVNLLTDEEYAFLLFFNMLFDKTLHKYMPFFSAEDFGADVTFLLVDNTADDDLDFYLYNFFDRDSIKLATRFFQYHLNNSILSPDLTTTIYNFSNTTSYITNTSSPGSKARIEKYLVFLDYLLFDLMKLENSIRLKIRDGKHEIGRSYYKLVTLIQATRYDLQNEGYFSYLELNDYLWKKIPLLNEAIGRNSFSNHNSYNLMNEELGLDDNFNLNKLEVPLLYSEHMFHEEELPVPNFDRLLLLEEALLSTAHVSLNKEFTYSKAFIEQSKHKIKINQTVLLGIQEALIIRQEFKSKSFKYLTNELSIENIYNSLNLTKKDITDNNMISFLNYYYLTIEKTNNKNLNDFLNSTRHNNFQYKTTKNLEQENINKRKEEIKRLYTRGATLEEIAIRLNISLRTVKYNFKDIQLSEDEIKKAKSNRNLVLDLTDD